MTLPRPQTTDERTHAVRFTHLDRWPMLSRYPVAPELLDEVMAQMFGCSPVEITAAVRSLEHAAERGARDLLADAEFRAAIDALPFTDGDVVVAVGDSLTADRLSWYELLTASMRLTGRTDVQTVNLAVSGNTTADVLERWDLVAAARPTHILLMLGTNDVRSHGRARHRMATSGETARNFAAISGLVTDELKAELTLITPPPAEPIRAAEFFDDLLLGWLSSDVDEVADVVRQVGRPYVDLHAALRPRVPSEPLWEEDGIHLNPVGQAVAATVIASGLTQ